MRCFFRIFQSQYRNVHKTRIICSGFRLLERCVAPFLLKEQKYHIIFLSILYKMIYQKVKADVMATAETVKLTPKDSYPL